MQKQTRNRTTEQQRQQIVDLWLSGAGKVDEIAAAMSMPKSTVYGVLYRSGVWPGYDNHLAGRVLKSGRQTAAKKQPAPKPTVVPPGSITVIGRPRRSLWQRIKDFFA